MGSEIIVINDANEWLKLISDKKSRNKEGELRQKKNYDCEIHTGYWGGKEWEGKVK